MTEGWAFLLDDPALALTLVLALIFIFALMAQELRK